MESLGLTRFNWIDLLSIVLILRMSYSGMRSGLATELARGIAVLVALVVCLRLYPGVAYMMTQRAGINPGWATAVAFAVTAIGPYLSTRLTLFLAQKLVTLQFISVLERGGGLAAGVVRGILVTSLVLNFLQVLPSGYLKASIAERSLMGQSISMVAPIVYTALGGKRVEARRVR